MTSIAKFGLVGILSLVYSGGAFAAEPVAGQTGAYRSDGGAIASKTNAVANPATVKVGEANKALPARVTSGITGEFKTGALGSSAVKNRDAVGTLPTSFESGDASAYRPGVDAGPSASKTAPSTGTAGVMTP